MKPDTLYVSGVFHPCEGNDALIPSWDIV